MVAMLVGACTSAGGSQASTSPSPSTSTVPSASTSVSPSATGITRSPALSEAAKEPNEAGARAFLAYVVAAVNWGYARMDSAPLDAVGLPGCEFCANSRRDIKAVKARGAHYDGATVTLVKYNPILASTDPLGYALDSILRQDPILVRDRAGTVLETFPRLKDRRVGIAIRWQDGGWRLVDVANLKGGSK